MQFRPVIPVDSQGVPWIELVKQVSAHAGTAAVDCAATDETTARSAEARNAGVKCIVGKECTVVGGCDWVFERLTSVRGRCRNFTIIIIILRSIYSKEDC